MGTEMENLVIGNCFLSKDDQNPSLRFMHAKKYEPD